MNRGSLLVTLPPANEMAAGESGVAGANVQNLGLTANTLTGVVTDAITGLPIGGATVQVTDSLAVVHTVSTDATGHYGVTNLPTGSATLTASQAGYASATSHPTIVSGPNSQNEALTANTLAGMVTNMVTGLPIAGATVQVTDSQAALHTVSTDVTGHYGVTNLPTGSATVTASQIGYASATSHPTIVSGANTQDEALTANTLAGVVTNTLTGFPIAGATVVVVDGANVTNTLTTDTGGHYAVTTIAAGAATVTATKTCHSCAAASLTIVAGANTQDLALTPNVLTGVVRDGVTGLPIPGAIVVVIDDTHVTNALTTAANGVYSITNLPAGNATVIALKSCYTIAIANPIIVPGINVQDLDLTANTLAGQVTDAGTHQPIAGATVQVVDSEGITNTATTDAKGNYTVTNLAKWIKVNAEPVLAANATAGVAYEVADPAAKPAETLVYRLVELEEQGTKQVYGPFTLRVEPPAVVTPTPALAGAASRSLKTAVPALASQSLARGAASVPLTALDGATFVKIVTTNGGMQKVSAASLASLLDQAQGSIQAAIAASSFLLSNQGEPVGYLLEVDGSGLSFYAEPLKDNYSAQNVYCLTTGAAVPVGSVDGQAPRVGLGRGGLSATASCPAVLDREQDLLAVPTLVQDPDQDYWMWQRLVAGLGMFDNAS
jgi:hypothetical protein